MVSLSDSTIKFHAVIKLTQLQIFYLCINVGSLSSIATTELEQRVGFWTAFLLCYCMFIVGIVVLVAGKKLYIVRPPRGSVIPNAVKAMYIGLANRGNMSMSTALFDVRRLQVFLDAAKPSYQDEYGRKYSTPWNDLFIDEVKRGLIACRVFVFYPIYWVVYSQMLNNFISQGIPPVFLDLVS